MIVENVVKKFTNLAQNVGKGVASIMYPMEYEYYMVAFELTTHDNETIDYLAFPVMPSQLKISEAPQTTIKKTIGGIVTTSLSGFVPRTINLSGNFGRNFVYLVNNKEIAANSLRFSTAAGVYDLNDNQNTKVKHSLFNNNVKTGYGTLKVLQSIIRKSNEQKDGKPFKLYFYNMAIGEHYLVKSNTFDVSMTMERNSIWDYNMTLTAIAYAFEDNKDRKDALKDLLTKSSMQKLWKVGFDTVRSIRQQFGLIGGQGV